MSQQQLLSLVIRVLEQAGIGYMVTGSVVSSLQGIPRSTHDIDVLVALNPEAGNRLMTAFPSEDYYLSADAIADALRERSMFNLISLVTGEKVDFWILTDEPFDVARFARKRPEKALGIRFNISTPEDTILAKLRWTQLSGGSRRHFTDVLRVYELQHKVLDMHYLDHWARQLGIVELWKQVQVEAEPI